MTIPNAPTYSHGSTGTEPTNSIDYANGDPLDADNLDYFLYVEFDKITKIIDTLDGLDSNDDGIVDEADTANLYKSNDIDSDGDGTVDEADSALTYKNNDIDTDGDGTVDAADDAANVTGTYKNNDIDTDGDGRVDAADHATNADDADTVDGSNVFVQSSSPSSPSSGDIWIDTA